MLLVPDILVVSVLLLWVNFVELLQYLVGLAEDTILVLIHEVDRTDLVSVVWSQG